MSIALGAAPPFGLQERFYIEVFDSLSDGVYFVTPTRQITFWNAAAERITGYSRKEVVGSLCFENLLRHADASGKELCHAGCPLAATILDGQSREAKVFLHHRKGHRVPVLVKVAPIRDAAGNILGAVEVFSDSSGESEAVRRMKELEQMAFLDPLTGAGNRRFAEQVIGQRLSELKRNQWSFGLLFIDIDHFKEVNDLYGHDMGDAVLQTVARTLMGVLRAHDFVARWGGEEFVVVVPQKDMSRLGEVAERLRRLVEASQAQHGKDRVRVTISIGATHARPEDRLEDLVGRADRLMYRSKAEGRNQVTMDDELSLQPSGAA